MDRSALRTRVQPDLLQDFDAVFDEWSRETGSRRVHDFIAHLVEWELVAEAVLASVRDEVSRAEVLVDDGSYDPPPDLPEVPSSAVSDQPVVGWGDDDDIDTEAETVWDADKADLLASLGPLDGEDTDLDPTLPDVARPTTSLEEPPPRELVAPEPVTGPLPQVGLKRDTPEPSPPLRDLHDVTTAFEKPRQERSSVPALLAALVLAVALGAWLLLG